MSLYFYAGFIPFFPDVMAGVCYTWEYNLPNPANVGTAPFDWEIVNDPYSYGEPDFGHVTINRDFYYLPEQSYIYSMMQPGCEDYTATFEVLQIPGAIATALQAFLVGYVTTTSPGPYTAFARWQLTWAAGSIDIQITCFYLWPNALVDPEISFETTWTLDYGGAGTPDYVHPTVGSAGTTTHGIPGTYTITDASLPAATAIYESTDGIGAIDDVIGLLTMLQ